MKRILVSLTFIFVCQFVFAQESFHDHRRHVEEEKKDDETTTTGFDWNKVFVGGTISLGYTTNTNGGLYTSNIFNIGAIPEMGYSLSSLLDVGISTTINYYSITTNQVEGVAQHQMDYGIGAFLRIHPLENFFIQAMPEQDFIKNKIITSGGSGNNSYQSTALLLGIGYGRRDIGRMYYYTVIMMDVAKDANSPYYYADPTSNGVYPLPILRGGLGFYLGKRK